MPQINFSEYRDEPTIVKSGSNVQIKCPVISERFNTYYVWYRFGESLEDYHHPRIKFGSKSGLLRIKSVRRSDGGPYTCEVINGFGNMKINVTIIVVPEDSSRSQESSITNYETHSKYEPSRVTFKDGSFEDEDGEEEELDIDRKDSKRKPNEESIKKNNGRPYLVNSESSTEIVRIVGEHFKLECNALGLPVPTIRWMYNNVPLQENTLPEGSNVQGGHLYIPKVTLKSAGKYTCVAFNELGQDSSDFELVVKEKEAEFVEDFPLESYEVQEGSTLTIKCRVRSPTKPILEWFRWKEDNQINTIEDQSLKLFKSKLNNLSTEGRTELILIGDDVYERSITIKSAGLSDEGNYACTCLIGKQFKYKSTKLVVTTNEINNTTYNVNLTENNSFESYGPIFPPMFLWIFGTIFLVTAAMLFILINWKTRTRVETFAVNAIEMRKPIGDRIIKNGAQVIEGSIDAFGDPINRLDGRALNTYTLINHRPQNYYWTRGRLDAWIDDSDKYTSYRRSRSQHVCRTCKKSTGGQHHSKKRRSTQSDHSRTGHRFGHNNTSEDNYKIYQSMKRYEDVWRQKKRLDQMAEVQSNLRHDYSAIKYSLDEQEVMAAPNNSPESNNS